jgi:hypothetical protein
MQQLQLTAVRWLRYFGKMKIKVINYYPHPPKNRPKKICAWLGFATYTH